MIDPSATPHAAHVDFFILRSPVIRVQTVVAKPVTPARGNQGVRGARPLAARPSCIPQAPLRPLSKFPNISKIQPVRGIVESTYKFGVPQQSPDCMWYKVGILSGLGKGGANL
jgi:hypothetical protein